MGEGTSFFEQVHPLPISFLVSFSAILSPIYFIHYLYYLNVETSSTLLFCVFS